MYEMQGPRLADQRKLTDCPSELVRRGNRLSARSGRPTTGPEHPQKFQLPGTLTSPELPLGGALFSLVEMFLRLNPAAHNPLRGLISRFFCCPPAYPPNKLTSPQNSELSTIFVHS